MSLLAPAFMQAEQLPVRTYTTVDGLARNAVTKIVLDSHGFLWFGTTEGLSRFDGYSFTTYGVDQGLPNRQVNDLLETTTGVLWVSTFGGLCRFNPSATGPRFTIYHPGESKEAKEVTALYEDRAHRLWCGTRAGLYRAEHSTDKQLTFKFIDLGLPNETTNDRTIFAITQDRHDAVWASAAHRLYRILSDRRIELYDTRHGLPFNMINDILEDREGRLWISTREGLCRLVNQPDPGRSVVARRYSTTDGLAADWVQLLVESTAGKLWAATIGGLSEFVPGQGPNGGRFRSYTQANGLSGNNLWALAEDREGNLWLGSESAGAMKIARNGFTTYTTLDGLANERISSLFEDRSGRLCAATGLLINCFDGRRFDVIRPNYGREIKHTGWGWNQTILQDHTGEWWLPTGVGVFRFPQTARAEQLARKAPKAIYTTGNGLASNDIFRLFEDSHGDIWITTINTRKSWLSRWERSTASFHHYTDADGLPRSPCPTAFSEDAEGALWMGFYEGGLARFREGHFTTFTMADGVPEGFVRQIFRDRAGRLWIATGQGLGRVDDPAAKHPHFVIYRTPQGLSSNAILCVTDDRWGRLYVATGRSVDRFDPNSGGARLGQIKHYTTADGLARGEFNVAFRDRQGALWFGSLQGLSRLEPEHDQPPSPPPVMVTALRIRGEPYRISELGESELRGLKLQPQQNQIQIDFVGLGFGPGELLRYQYELEGADLDWSTPTEQRIVNYASLAPGTYRFLVRAINADGVSSPKPASVEFTVVPPVWQRWWFRLLTLVLCASIVYAVYRYRVAQLLELERVRTRIATDLHDDIGSSLSQIAILSEVLSRRMGDDDGRFTEPLSQIAGASREMVASMSDIVWAINPHHDHLRDLAQRMRRFASDVFTARKIDFDFRAPGTGQDVKLGADMRRQIFLIFKESVNNMLRHSGCSRAEIQFLVEHDWLVMRLTDNGKGFDPCDAIHGQGLTNMRRRANNLGGEVTFTSAPDQGTNVTLRVPLGRLSVSRLPKTAI